MEQEKKKGIINQPETCVWELTTQCNLHCVHCASSCIAPREDELGQKQIMQLAEQVADIGVRWVSLTGGEILMTDCWQQVASYLESRSVKVHMITNGTLITPDIVEKMCAAKVSMVSVSLDGTQNIHDMIRKQGSYDKSCNGLRLMKDKGIRTGCITSVMKENLPVLEEMKRQLLMLGVECWQLQTAFPEGNMRSIAGSMLEPSQILTFIDIAYRLGMDSAIRIILPDNVGYYTERETILRSRGKKKIVAWKGCNAGIRSFGILSNGDIVGCTAMRGKEFIEGNIKNHTLQEIWESPNAFAWRRNLKVSDLQGKCAECQYAGVCLGGCSNIRYTVNGTVCSSNPYCACF